MRQQNKQLAILFADIAGSTSLYETLGDTRARELTAGCIKTLSTVTQLNRGRVIKTIGDEVMCTFPTAADAARAAVMMQETISSQAATNAHGLAIKVGFHYGDVLEEDGDVFGDAVNVAARMVGQANAEQIITTGDTVGALDPQQRHETRLVVARRVKGKRQRVEIHELTWGEEEEVTTLHRPAMFFEEEARTELRAEFEGRSFVVDEGSPSLTMGRAIRNNFAVGGDAASRRHAKIELRAGRFLLVDASTNGSHIRFDDGRRVFVHRDEHALEGSGIIGLGEPVDPGSPLAIKFDAGGAGATTTRRT